jgi:aspartate carbamoyltransferase catalytic subunit
LKLCQGVTCSFLAPKGLEFDETKNDDKEYDELITKADIVYFTRIQSERHSLKVSPIIIDNALLQKSKAFIMHPFPRNEELSDHLDKDPRALYWKQMEYGVYVRMALIQQTMCEWL